MMARAGLFWRAALVVLCLWVCLGSRSSAVLLDALLPAQRSVFALLMPEFDVRSFDVQTRGAHLKLRAVTQNHHHLVLGGRAHPPGIEFEAETPARAALLHALLIVAGALFTLPGGRHTRRVVAPLAAACALFMAIVPAAVVLAGQQWGLGVQAGAEPTLAAALVAASSFLIHGGGFALCAAMLWALSACARRWRERRTLPGSPVATLP
jgi:hypothetical protein